VSRILLVRHGQASFGAEDYDQLSPLGEEQSRALGAALAARGVVPTAVVAGAMKRHGQTASAAREAAGWDLEPTVDDGWNEFDHVQVLSVHTPPESDDSVPERVAFQRWFEEATLRWTRGRHDEEYDEPFDTFTDRVRAALDRLTAGLGPGENAVVFTSGGPVAWAAASLLGGGSDLWLRLNPVTVNTGTSLVVVGRRGPTLVSLNDHAHLSPDHVTSR
jgi:broad specificity phosphatase PhoE